jgi:hypothetical protein
MSMESYKHDVDYLSARIPITSRAPCEKRTPDDLDREEHIGAKQPFASGRLDYSARESLGGGHNAARKKPPTSGTMKGPIFTGRLQINRFFEKSLVVPSEVTIQ